MKKRINFIATTILSIIMWGSNFVNAQTFSNVQVRQEDIHVYITYDMKGQLQSNSEVLLGYSIDGGKNFRITNSAEGDVGKKITPGVGKEIRWSIFNTECSGKSTKFTVGTMKDFIPDGFVYIPGGRFTMGDVWEDGRSNEKPTHEVDVDAFYMTKFEIKQKLYEDVMGTNPSEFVGINNPVEGVSWEKAIEFCNKLSQIKGLNPCYTINGDNVDCDWNANGYRLPSEAEWEYAARSGGRNDQKYAGTNEASSLSAFAWHDAVHQVGTKRPNDLGLFDMSGNVWEWCWDAWHTSFRGTRYDQRVVRGGSFFDPLYHAHSGMTCLRTTFRTFGYVDHPGLSEDDGEEGRVGFRIVGQNIYENQVKRNISESGLETISYDGLTLSKSYFPFRSYFNNRKNAFIEKSRFFQGNGTLSKVTKYLFPRETFYGITLSIGGSDLLNQKYVIDELDTTNQGDGAKTIGIDLDIIRFAFGRGGAGKWSQDLIQFESVEMLPYRWEIPFFIRTSIGLPMYLSQNRFNKKYNTTSTWRLFFGFGYNGFASALVLKNKTILESQWNNSLYHQVELSYFIKEYQAGVSLGFIKDNYSMGGRYRESYLRLQLALFN